MKSYNIIIVENDEDEREFMKAGFDTVPELFSIQAQLVNGDALLEWLNDHENELPDIVLSDLNMPGKNGYDIIEALKENPDWSHIPVVITSTSSTPTIINKCLAAGAADYMVKPDTFIEYASYIKQFYNRIREKNLVKSGD
jgi:CheY-like chemotaxis protein